jgi:hypothetical protein
VTRCLISVEVGRFRLTGGRRAQLLEVIHSFGCRVASSRPDEVDRAVDRDAVEPGTEVRAGLEPADLPIRAQKRLLDDVLGVVLVARHPVGEPEDGAAVSLDQRAECLAVALARPSHHQGVALWHPVG